MIHDILTEWLKKSNHYNITEVIDSDDDNPVHLQLNNEFLWLVIQKSKNSYRVIGDNDQRIKELRKCIDNEIRLPLREKSIEILNNNLEVWNQWRKEFSQFQIDLSQKVFENTSFSGIDFSNVDLSYSIFKIVNFEGSDFENSIMHETQMISCRCERSNFSNVDANLAVLKKTNFNYSRFASASFGGADLHSATLQGIKFRNVNLKYADLSRSDLRGANLSRAVINTETSFDKALGVKEGLNGYWNADTDSAALFSVSPSGDSMKGPNIEAVIKSLVRARKYFGFSFLISLGAIMLWFLKQESTSLPFFTDFELTNFQYLGIGMTFSLGLLLLSKSFLDDAFEGMKYLEDRKSAMAVGSFPWVLTKFSGEKIDQKIISIISRLVLCLHPVAYLFLFDFSQTNYAIKGLFIALFAIGIWVLVFSVNFQKPILFDQQTETDNEEYSIINELETINKTLCKLEEINKTLKETLSAKNTDGNNDN